MPGGADGAGDGSADNLPPREILSRERHFLETRRFVSTPFLAAIASFYLYPTTSRLFHGTAQFLSHNNWVPVDGGQLQWSVLLPALNGVVMTAISLLYANLISTTGTQLRNRQIKIQEALSSEVDGIRGLAQLLPYYPTDAKLQCGAHLTLYIRLLVRELGPECDAFDLRSTIPPLSKYRELLHRVGVRGENDERGPIHGNVLERSYEMLDRLSAGRSSRVASLQTTFPPLHYVTISALTAAILFVFLIETDRPVILFLDNFQLRLIWSLLVWTQTAIFCIGIDLNSPFVGTYVVPADQFLDESEDLLGVIEGTLSNDISGNGPPATADERAGAGHQQLEQEQQRSLWERQQLLLQPPQQQQPPPQYDLRPPAALESSPNDVATISSISSKGIHAQDANTSSIPTASRAESFEEYMRRRSMGEYNN